MMLLMFLGGALVCSGAISDPVRDAQLADFKTISLNIERYHPSHWAEYERVSAETYRHEALILEDDQTAVDVILRRTAAILEQRTQGKYVAALQELKQQNHPGLSLEKQKSLFLKVAALRRTVMFSDPALDFDKLLFLKHDRMARGEPHMVDQYLGFNQTRGGGVYQLDNPFSEAPKQTDLLEKWPIRNGRLKGKTLDFDAGSYIALDLDYAGERLLFAFSEVKWEVEDDPESWKNQPWTQVDAAGQWYTPHYFWKPESSFHIFEADLKTQQLRQLTDGMWDDFDPCYLPNGRIIFISARCGGNQRCGRRYAPTYTLHTMMPDGTDIQQLSFHDTNEWFPSVNNDGMVIYTRWDYVDRDADVAHHLWFCTPDGRDPRTMHGNYSKIRQLRPWFEGQSRAIPDSKKYISVAASHHGETYGSLILIDQSVPDNSAMAQVKRITPYTAFPESETTPGKTVAADSVYKLWEPEYHSDLHYGTPWALNQDLYLCVYDPEGSKKHTLITEKSSDNYGIYLVDSYGNRELIYRDPEISCLDPMPLRSRLRPPVLPVKTKQMAADRDEQYDLTKPGTVAVMNVYAADIPFPEGVKIKALRIINIFPKDTWGSATPRIGAGKESLARGVLGTVPVEEDGSAYFECPTGMSVYFQALDENGMMVQNMRSSTYLHPGEQLTCIGCHENKRSAPNLKKTPMAVMRSPSKITPEMSGSYPLTFPRLVQPVLDKHCVSCHEKKAPKHSLRGDKFTKLGWSEAMHTLSEFAWAKHGTNFGILENKRSYSIPMQEGAYVSKLYAMLKKGHEDVQLSAEELRRITLWMDCNSNFFGAYTGLKEQASGEVILPAVGHPRWTKDPQKFVR